MAYYILIFIASSLSFLLSGNIVVKSLLRLAKVLGWREFVVGFAVMSLATSTPNLFIGISSVLRGIPQLSFGDVVGGNVVDLTLVAGLAALLGQGIKANSRMVQTSSIFTLAIAALPMFLVADGFLSRGDGLILLATFAAYVWWLFSKEERFSKSYDETSIKREPFLKSFIALVFGLALLILASQGIVVSAAFFAQALSVPIGLIGILIVGLGTCLPEIVFTIISARKKEEWLVLGDLMGSVITCATLVLGMVAVLSPIRINDFSPYFLARAFLMAAAMFFLLFIRSGKRLSRKEGLFLIFLYIAFLISETLLR